MSDQGNKAAAALAALKGLTLKATDEEASKEKVLSASIGMTGRKVFRVEDGDDPSTILCTTYQMRNFYRQFGDGFFSSLDVMNYIQHHAAALWAGTGDLVLDVCCGRSLMLPLLRYCRPKIQGYIGVDIEPKNFGEAYRRAGACQDISSRVFSPLSLTRDSDSSVRVHSSDPEPFYPFPVWHVESNVAVMQGPIKKALADSFRLFDLVIYTSAIEHMQRAAAVDSLKECYALMKPGGIMFLSTPNTHGDPYDTQNRAHLSEWSRETLLAVCLGIGFKLRDELGLVAKVTGYRDKLKLAYPHLLPIFDRLSQYLPSAWLYSLIPILTPDLSDEILLILER